MHEIDTTVFYLMQLQGKLGETYTRIAGSKFTVFNNKQLPLSYFNSQPMIYLVWFNVLVYLNLRVAWDFIELWWFTTRIGNYTFIKRLNFTSAE